MVLGAEECYSNAPLVRRLNDTTCVQSNEAAYVPYPVMQSIEPGVRIELVGAKTGLGGCTDASGIQSSFQIVQPSHLTAKVFVDTRLLATCATVEALPGFSYKLSSKELTVFAFNDHLAFEAVFGVIGKPFDAASPVVKQAFDTWEGFDRRMNQAEQHHDASAVLHGAHRKRPGAAVRPGERCQ